MATTNNRTGFESLDDILLPGDDGSYRAPRGYDFLNSDIGAEISEAKRISANTADKAYRKLTSHSNVTSYSLLGNLHKCPRLFELEKLQANSEVLAIDGQVNLDFAFGHAVGAGIQTYAATGNLMAAQFAGFLAWRAPWDAEKLDKRDKPTGKSLAHAMHAIEKFSYFWEQELNEYEVVRIDGKPATELAFAVDFQQPGTPFYHFGHIDTILMHKTRKTLAVWEGKTTSMENIDEAEFANSNQALGYSVVVDRIAQLIGAEGTEYEVLYIIFSSKSREFTLLPFGKTRTQRAEWLQDTLLDHSAIATYQRIGFYPKRGENCVNRFGRKCQWFGQCQMSNDTLFPGVSAPPLELVTDVESLDYQFKLSELITAQKGNS
jgi:PD-(D/E)XK nuclease superfamily